MLPLVFKLASDDASDNASDELASDDALEPLTEGLMVPVRPSTWFVLMFKLVLLL